MKSPLYSSPKKIISSVIVIKVHPIISYITICASAIVIHDSVYTCVCVCVWTRAWKVLGKGLKLILIYLQIGSSADHFLSAPLPLLPPSSTSKDSMFCWKRNFHSLDGTRRVYSSHTSSLLNLQYLYQTYYHQEKLTWLWRAWFILYRLPIEQIKFSSHKLY